MGLTGLIVSAAISLKRIDGPLIDQETIRFGSLDEFFDISRESDATHEYTVAWVDCIAREAKLGRGVFYRGNSTPKDDWRRRRRSLPPVPIDAPTWLLAPTVMKTFNLLYYHRTRRRRVTRTVHYEGFFFPLDSLPSWNRLYGKRGFLQHQCVVPFEGGNSAIREILERVVHCGNASFLAVLKTFGGVSSPGMMSFPRPGVTLAMDFPFKGTKTLQLLDELDGVVRAAGGALYPAKDCRMTAETFRVSNPKLDTFREFVDPEFSSSLWRRVNT
ncbi:MAG: hypothetical protein ACYC9N_00355 [Thermoanaerobaculia bacterium]